MAPWTPRAGGARVDSGIEAKDVDVAVIGWSLRGLATGWVSELVHEGEFHAPARRAPTVRDACLRRFRLAWLVLKEWVSSPMGGGQS
jgi:hypothetical protein